MWYSGQGKGIRALEVTAPIVPSSPLYQCYHNVTYRRKHVQQFFQRKIVAALRFSEILCYKNILQITFYCISSPTRKTQFSFFNMITIFLNLYVLNKLFIAKLFSLIFITEYFPKGCYPIPIKAIQMFLIHPPFLADDQLIQPLQNDRLSSSPNKKSNYFLIAF